MSGDIERTHPPAIALPFWHEVVDETETSLRKVTMLKTASLFLSASPYSFISHSRLRSSPTFVHSVLRSLNYPDPAWNVEWHNRHGDARFRSPTPFSLENVLRGSAFRSWSSLTAVSQGRGHSFTPSQLAESSLGEASGNSQIDRRGADGKLGEGAQQYAIAFIGLLKDLSSFLLETE